MKRRKFLTLAGAAAMGTVWMLTGCGKKEKPAESQKSIEEQLLGDWYLIGSNYVTLSFYEDGTYKQAGDYGLGKWAIFNENQLRLVDFYGEDGMVSIVKVDENILTVGAPATDPENTNQLSYYRTAEDAIQAREEYQAQAQKGN